MDPMDASGLTRPRPPQRGPRHRRRRVTPTRVAVAAALAAALGLATAALAVAMHLTGQMATSRDAVTGLSGQVSALAGQVSALSGQVSDAQARAASAAAAASAASAAARRTPTTGVCVNVVYATASGARVVAAVQVTPPVKGTAGAVSCPVGTFVPATPRPSPSPVTGRGN